MTKIINDPMSVVAFGIVAVGVILACRMPTESTAGAFEHLTDAAAEISKHVFREC